MKIHSCGVHTYNSTDRLELGGIHPHHEILFLSTGSYEFEWLGRIRYLVSAPALFLMPSNILHRTRNQSDAHGFWYIGLRDVGTDEFPELNEILMWNELQCSDQSPIMNNKQLMWTLNSIGELLNSESESTYFHELVMCDIRKLIVLVHRWLDNNPTNTSDIFWTNGNISNKTGEELVNIVLDYMEGCFNLPLTLDDLSNKVHLNPSYLIRIFKKITGVTPMQYLTELRMNAAICYLSSADMTIEDIAERTGYSSIHHFSSLFKRRYGISPSHWRNQKMGLHDLRMSSGE